MYVCACASHVRVCMCLFSPYAHALPCCLLRSSRGGSSMAAWLLYVARQLCVAPEASLYTVPTIVFVLTFTWVFRGAPERKSTVGSLNLQNASRDFISIHPASRPGISSRERASERACSPITGGLQGVHTLSISGNKYRRRFVNDCSEASCLLSNCYVRAQFRILKDSFRPA